MTRVLQNFYKQTITRNWTATTGDFNVSVAPTVAPGYLVVSPNNATLREIIYYTSTGSNSYGDYVRVANVTDRGLGGTSAQIHTIGETVRLNITAEYWADMEVEIAAIVAGSMIAPGTAGNVMLSNGSAWTSSSSYGDAQLKIATVTLSSAEILALYTTPKTLIAAPGAGKIIIPETIILYLDYGTATYTAGGVVRVSFNGETTQLLGTTTMEANLVEKTADTVVIGNFIPISTTPTDITVGINKALEITNNTANFTTGDSIIKVFIKYRILTL